VALVRLQLTGLHPEGSLFRPAPAQRHAQLSSENIFTSRCLGQFIHGLLVLLGHKNNIPV
jgi:hypothetical protein